jgi:hypothetical protein
MRPGRGTKQLSRKRATGALAMLLSGCTQERLAGFTAASLASSYNVPLAKAAELLDRARQGRLV